MSMIPYGEPGQWGKNTSDSTTFSKVVLPLTDKQTRKAARLYMPGFDDMTKQMQELIIDSGKRWQGAIQEAAKGEKVQ